jgi:YD repeat-containing protein
MRLPWDSNSSYSYGYDAANRLTSVNNSGTPGVPQVTLSYGYDAYGNRTSLSDSLGGSISFSFDAAKNLTGLILSLNGTAIASVAMAYDAASRLTSLTRTAPSVSGDTITTTLTYDNANRLTNLATADTTKSITLANYTYGYDKASQLTSYQDNNNSSLTYSYDNNGELTGASGTLNGSNYAVTYSYDANGNRNMTGYQTGAGNELLTDGTYSYTYDHNGNLVTQKDISTGVVTTYTWDYRNRLTEVQVGSSTETFTYDVNNNRIGESLNGTVTVHRLKADVQCTAWRQKPQKTRVFTMLHQSYTEHTISDECAEMLISNRLAYSVVHYHNCEPSKKAVISAFLDIALFSVHPLSGGERLQWDAAVVHGVRWQKSVHRLQRQRHVNRTLSDESECPEPAGPTH